ncbi:MAG TPA: amino acid adenylation domain-containing protein, partial [Actinomycetota bacterium]|nr:amino acid adenylation domain-containing protein [Actinomycetota bacterium]
MSDRAPLSAAQRGLWALEQLAPRSAFYNVAAAYRLRGRIDVAALEAAFAAVVARHDVLRTTIEDDDGVPRGRVHDATEFALSLDDRSYDPPGRSDAEAMRAAAVEAGRPFDLAADLPVRARLLRLGPEDHVLSVTAHHVAADEAALRTVLAEVAAAYSSGAAALPPAPLQYADLARREAGALRGEDLDVLLAFWRKTLRDAPAEIRLPFDHPRPAVPTFRGAAAQVASGADVAGALDAVAGARATTFETVVLAAFAALLHRYTSDDDLVVGWPVDGRTAETSGVVGTFVNVLPLRLRVRRHETFGELVDRVDAAVEAVREHRALPLETLIEELRPRRPAGRSPLFQVAISVADEGGDGLDLPGVETTPLELQPSTAPLDLFAGVERSPGALRTRFEVATDVFDPATIHALARHWANLLAAVAADPDAPVGALPLLDAAEAARLVGRSRGATPPATTTPVHEAVSRVARDRPDAVAVLAPGEEVTYEELDARSAEVAASLVDHGVAPGSVVGLLAERSASLVPAMVGILRAGCAYLPLDRSYPPERLTFMLDDSRAAAVVGDPPAGLRLPPGVAVVTPGPDRRAAPVRDVTDRDAAYVIYTSGSTGRPKGVTVEHGSLGRFVATIASEFRLTPADRVLQFASLSFDTSVEEIWPALVAGATVVLREPHPPSPEELRALVVRNGITVLDLPTAYWHEVAAECADGVDVRDAESLRLVVVGGEAMSGEATRSWTASARRTVRLLNTYGPTETTVTATSFDATEWRPSGGVPIGRPLPGTTAYVLDDDLQPAPDGVTGELYVGGAGVARGYLGRPAATAERFLPDPWSDVPGARMYATGDLVRRGRDGVLSFAGRRDLQVKIRGFRVEPGEVESVLAAHPAIADAAVVATGDPPRLAAYFVPAGTGVDPAAVGSWLRERLPEHMVPAVSTPLEALPKTPGGKVDRAALAARDAGGTGTRGVTPRTPTEDLLASIWEGLLGIERVGVDESFFDLGGHSLLATQLVSRIRRAFGVSLPLRTVFEWPTIAGLAAVVDRSAGDSGDLDELPLEPVDRAAPLPLSFAQQRLWFIDQFKPGSADYVIAARAEICGPLDAGALRDALRDVGRRHEALRTTFPSHGGEARQEIAPEPEVVFRTFDLSGAPPGERDDAAAGVVA